MPYLQLASLKLKLLRFIRYTYPILPCSVYIFSVGKCSSLSNLTSIKYCLNNHSLCLERLIYNWIQKLLAIARFYQSVTSWLLLSEVLFFLFLFMKLNQWNTMLHGQWFHLAPCVQSLFWLACGEVWVEKGSYWFSTESGVGFFFGINVRIWCSVL